MKFLKIPVMSTILDEVLPSSWLLREKSTGNKQKWALVHRGVPFVSGGTTRARKGGKGNIAVSVVIVTILWCQHQIMSYLSGYGIFFNSYESLKVTVILPKAGHAGGRRKGTSFCQHLVWEQTACSGTCWWVSCQRHSFYSKGHSIFRAKMFLVRIFTRGSLHCASEAVFREKRISPLSMFAQGSLP